MESEKKRKGYYCNCENCGHPVDTVMEYCPNCDAKLPEIKTEV